MMETSSSSFPSVLTTTPGAVLTDSELIRHPTECSPAESVISEALPTFTSLSSASVYPLWTPPPLEAKSLPLTAHDRLIDDVIVDLGDVLFTWSADTGTSISPKTLHSILRSSNWFEYEKGNISEEEAYSLTAAEFSLDASEVRAAILAVRGSIQINLSMVTLLHELKEKSNIRLFAMSNISAPDWEVVYSKGRPEVWALFERVFRSAVARERKPNLGYYRHVLESTGIDPRRTAFVDDKLENVVSARSLGLKGIVYTSFDEVAQELRALAWNPASDGEECLREHAKEIMESVIETGIIIEENSAQLLIPGVTGDQRLVNYVKYPRLSDFFKCGTLTTLTFPYGLDTTSIAYTVSDQLSPKVKNDILNEILTLKNKDGIILTYFGVARPRIDPVICDSALTFYSNSRGNELQETFNWIYEVLENRAFTNGTFCYYGPDTFLYFFSRLHSVSLSTRQQIGQLFAKRVAEHCDSEGDALALAMRIHAASVVDLCDSPDYERLGKMQEADGLWPRGWIYKYGSSDILIGNKDLTTALAVSAMQSHRELEYRLGSFE